MRGLVLPLFILSALFFGALGFALLAIIDQNPVLQTISLSFLLPLPVALASLVTSRGDLLSPLSMLLMLMIVSSPVFMIFVYYFADPNDLFPRLYGLDFQDMNLGITLLAAGSISLVLGYLIFPKRSELVSAERLINYSAIKLRSVMIFTIILSIWGTLAYLADFGGLDAVLSDGLSKKRVDFDTQGIAPRGSSFTHWRFLSYRLPQALVLVALALAWSGKISLNKKDYVLIALLFALSTILPFIASSRGRIFEVLLMAVILRHHLVKRTNFLKIGAAVGLILIAVGILGEIRTSSSTNQNAAIASNRSESGPFSIFNKVIASSYFMDLSKTSVVVSEVPEKVDYLYGRSLAFVAIAFVPRQIWPEKPIVRIGYFVGQEVIELNNETGIPPGFIAELYLNFGYLGVFLPMFGVGMLLKYLYSPVQEMNQPGLWALAYAIGSYLILKSLLTGDFTFFVIQTAFYGLPVILFLRICRKTITKNENSLRSNSAISPLDGLEKPL